MDFKARLTPEITKREEKKKELQKLDVEKRQMLGRTGVNGTPKLRKLTQRHIRIISMHLTGNYKGVEIAEKVGCTVTRVYQVLNDPLAKKIIDDFQVGQIADMEELMPKVVDAVRDGPVSGDQRVRLSAVDRYAKMTQRGDDGEGKAGVNLNLTVVDARERFVDNIRNMIDVTPEPEPATET